MSLRPQTIFLCWCRQGQKLDLFLIVITHWVELKPSKLTWAANPGFSANLSPVLCPGFIFIKKLYMQLFFWSPYCVHSTLLGGKLYWETSRLIECWKCLSPRSLFYWSRNWDSKRGNMTCAWLLQKLGPLPRDAPPGTVKSTYEPSHCMRCCMNKFPKVWSKLEVFWEKLEEKWGWSGPREKVGFD